MQSLYLISSLLIYTAKYGENAISYTYHLLCVYYHQLNNPEQGLKSLIKKKNLWFIFMLWNIFFILVWQPGYVSSGSCSLRRCSAHAQLPSLHLIMRLRHFYGEGMYLCGTSFFFYAVIGDVIFFPCKGGYTESALLLCTNI